MQGMQETWVQSLGWENPLEEKLAAHSSVLAWRIPWTERPDGLQSMGLQKSRTKQRLNNTLKSVQRGSVAYAPNIWGSWTLCTAVIINLKISSMKWSSIEFYYLLVRKENNEREVWAISKGHKYYVFCRNCIFCNCLDVVQHKIFKWNIFKSDWSQSYCWEENVAYASHNLKNHFPTTCILRLRAT